MKTVCLVVTLLLAIVSLTAKGQTGETKKSCVPCEQLKNLHLPDVTILKIESLAGDTIKSEVEWVPTVVICVPFCRVLGRISKEINFGTQRTHQKDFTILLISGCA